MRGCIFSVSYSETDEQKRIAENMVIQGLDDTLIISVTGIARERLDASKNDVKTSE